MKIFINLPKIEQADNMSAYLVGVTNNTIIDYYRKKATLPLQQEPSDRLPAEVARVFDTSPSLADCCLRPMIESLPPIYRDALIMIDLEGLKHKQFADEAGITLTNAKTRVQKAGQRYHKISLE